LASEPERDAGALWEDHYCLPAVEQLERGAHDVLVGLASAQRQGAKGN